MDKPVKFLILFCFAVSTLFLLTLFMVNRHLIKFVDRNYTQNKVLRISDEIHDQIELVFLGADYISRDQFIQNWLASESDRDILDRYLEEYISILGCDAIDVASTGSGLVYQSAGTTVLLDKENERDAWFFDLQSSEQRWGTELFYDSLKGTLYIYYNVKILDQQGENLGVLGFLLSYDNLSSILTQFEDDGISAYITDSKGEILVHGDQSQIGNITIYDYFGKLQEYSSPELSGNKEHASGTSYVRYIGKMDACLIVEQGRSFARFSHMSIVLLSFLFWGISFLLGFVLYRNFTTHCPQEQGKKGRIPRLLK